MSEDCASVGFSGEGRCIEPAAGGDLCESHAIRALRSHVKRWDESIVTPSGDRRMQVHVGNFVGGRTARYCYPSNGRWWFQGMSGKWRPCPLDHQANDAGPRPVMTCTCGEIWRGHPNPHAITCPSHRLAAAAGDPS